LDTIRECDVFHVVRSIENDDIFHVNAKVIHVGDADVFTLDLIFADLAHVGNMLE
jgi:ribosome-binding ATPase YchF (GTP1/OBG family)